MTYNLDTLKQELLDYIVAEGFAVFRSQSGALEGLPTIYWDTETHPEYQPFLNVAKSADVRIIVFAHREFEEEGMRVAPPRLVYTSRRGRKSLLHNRPRRKY